MNLGDKAMMVILNIRQWAGEKIDAKATAEVLRQHGAKDGTGNFRKLLLDKSALGQIRKKAGEMRNRHYELTLPWADDGYRIIASTGFFRYRSEMQVYQGQIEELVCVFLNEYEGHVQAAMADMGSLFDARDYPHNGELRRRFRTEIKFRPVPMADDFRVDLAGAEVDAIKQQIEADVRESLNGAMRETTERIREAITHLSAKLKAYEGTRETAFRDSTVENVADLADILPGLNLTGDKRIAEVIREMKSELTRYSAVELRDSEPTRLAVASKADEILAKMKDYDF